MLRPHENAVGTRQQRRTRRIYVLGAVAMAALVAVVVFRRPLFAGNFGVVDPGRVYRCAQPDGNLGWVLDTCRPASILNLRGGSQAKAWYAAEVNASQERHIDFYDIPMSPTRRPMRHELLTLLEVLDRCRYPLLIHCKSGADRTGLASALYLMERRGEPPESALRAFTIGFGHVPLGGPEHLHEPFVEYGAWLKDHHLAHSPEQFRTWVTNHYRADDPPHDPPIIKPGPRLQANANRRTSIRK
ncbi:MAG TPA: tyrosine-protein phosphatase [Isosphaeraceae bacterium]|nr:tyrosine-protein phosphatase [Isosphaeraceae bacterium]